MPRILDVQFPDVASQASPVPSQHIQTTPEMFGGALGEAEQKLGKDVTEAAGQQLDIYNETAANSLYNDFVERIQKAQWGDPSDPNSKGIMTQQGEDAMRAGHGVTDQFEQIRQQVLAGAPNGRAALMADMAMRRQMAYAMERVNDKVNRETQAWQKSTYTDGVHNAARGGYLDPSSVEDQLADAAHNHIRLDNATTPGQIKASTVAGETQVIHSTFNGYIDRGDKAGAIAFLDKYGDRMDPVTRHELQPIYNDAKGQLAATGYKSDYQTHTRLPGPGNRWSPPDATPQQVQSYIYRAAQERGINPEIAVRVAHSEWGPTYTGDQGRSFGPFQLFTGGGLGNRALEAGIDVRNPATWRQQVDFALDNAAQNKSWAPWHGAANVGIPHNAGFGLAGVSDVPFSGREAFGGRKLTMPAGGTIPVLSFDEALPMSFKEYGFDRIDKDEKAGLLDFDQAMKARRYVGEMDASDRAANAGERLTLEREIPNYMAVAEAGIPDAPELPMDKVNALLGPVRGRQIAEEYEISKHAGVVMSQLTWATPAELADAERDVFHGQGRLSDAIRTSVRGGATGPGTVGAEGSAQNFDYIKMKERLATKTASLIQQREKALHDDPAAYALRNPRVKQAYDSGNIDSFAQEMFGMQEHLGVRRDEQHLLPVQTAKDMAEKLMAAQDVQKAITEMAQKYGNQWDNVFHDISTEGGLSPAYQTIATLESAHDASNIQRWDREVPKDKAVEDLLGKTFVTDAKQKILTDKRVTTLVASLTDSHIPQAQIESVVQTIEKLTWAKKQYDHIDDPVDDAIKSVTGHWEFMGSGARIPAKQFEPTVFNANQDLHSLAPTNILKPDNIGGLRQPTLSEYLETVKAGGQWITEPKGKGLWIKDPMNRILKTSDGKEFFVPFADSKNLPAELQAPPLLGVSP
jgi:hypothetical protein